MAKKSLLRRMARLGALDSDNALRLIEEQDGGPGSGNFGHAGRPGKIGGSAPEGQGGGSAEKSSSGNAGHVGSLGPVGGASASPRGVEKARSVIKNVLKGMNPGDDKNAKNLKRDLEWVAEAPDNKEFLRRSRDVKELWDKVVKEGPADFPYKEYGDFLKAAGMSERMSNRGNYGRQGRVGKVGGSAESVSHGIVSGNLGQNSSGQKFVGKDYSLKAKGLQTITRHRDRKTGKMAWSGPGRTWQAVGEKTKTLPNGSGTTRIAEKDIAIGLHTINKYLDKDGNLTPERAAMHERIIQKMFEGKKKPGPGEQKTFYFLGGGSASGKSSFTKPGKSDTYSLPNSEQCTVIDPDLLKNDIPEYQFDNKTKTGTGTTNRNIAASWAHEESSALAKRAMQAAFDNGYNCTLDGTGDSGAAKVIGKLDQARKAGYRVEGRYCTKEIEQAIETNIERAIRSGRMVQIDELVRIHKDVSNIFPEIAPHFDHVELWDHNDRNQPVLIATCEKGGKIKVKDQAMYDRFIAKKDYNYDPNFWKKKAEEIRNRIEREKRLAKA